MNTVKSVYYGWAALIVAGGGAYVFAKRSINAERAAKAEADREKRIRQWQLEHDMSPSPSTRTATTPLNPTSTTAPRSITSEVGRLRKEGAGGDGGYEEGNPSSQASVDPAPTRHAPEDEAQRVGEKSKYEASVPYRSRGGDRFS